MDENIGAYKETVERLYTTGKFFYPKYFNSAFSGRPPTRDFNYNGQKISKANFIEEALAFAKTDNFFDALSMIARLGTISDAELAATLPGAALREEQAERLEEEQIKLKETQEKAKTDVRAAIDRKKKIVEDKIKIAQAAKEKLEKETKFVKVEKEPSQPALSEDFVNETKKDPIKTYDFLVKDMESKIPEDEAPKKDIEFAAAYIVVNVIKEDKAAADAFTAQKLKDYPELKNIGEVFADPSMEQHNLAKVIADRAYGTNNPFVPTIKSIEISDTNQPGFTALPLYNFAERAEANLKGQKQILDGKIDRPAWMVSELEKQLAIIRGGGIQGAEGNYRDFIVQGYLLKFSPGPAITEGAAAINTRLDIASGAGDSFKIVAGGIIKQAAIKTAAKGLVGLISKAAAPETGGLSIVAAQALNWIADKINTKDVKKWFLAGAGAVMAVAGFAFGFPTIGLFGLGIGGVGVASAQGITLTGAGSGVLSAIGAIGAATLGAIGAPILAALIGLPVLVALILFIINSGAYVVPPSPSSLASRNQYIDVIKTATPAGPFQNSDLPLKISYAITITAKKENVTGVTIDHTCTATSKSGNKPCPAPKVTKPDGSPISTISVGSPTTFSYDETYDNSYKDAFVVNTVSVTGNVTAEKDPQQTAATAAIKIGNPPDVCPNGWPVSGSFVITQTPNGGYSHSGIEAMDIGMPIGTPVTSTSTGTATVVYTSGPYAPVYVDVTSNCGGKTIKIRYAHFSAVFVKSGDPVTFGEVLGRSGTEGTGPHLHYEFYGITMGPPYIPKPIIRGCSSDTGACGTIP